MLETDDVYEMAAALFGMSAPDLPTPTAILREEFSVEGIARFSLRTKAGTYRLKYAVDPGPSAQLLRGAALLKSLSAQGLPVPESLVVRRQIHGFEAAVTVETRPGTSDAAAAWPRLRTKGRLAVAEDAARALALLHTQKIEDLPPLGLSTRRVSETSSLAGSDPLPSRSTPMQAVRPRSWRETIGARAERAVHRLRAGEVLAPPLAEGLERRFRTAIERLPVELERRPCHGQFCLDAMAVDSRAFVGMRDFETACLADPWIDVAYWLGSTGDPDAPSSRRFLDAYREKASAPADLSTRMDLYGGLTILRSMGIASTVPVQGSRELFTQLVDAWLSHPPRAWD